MRQGRNRTDPRLCVPGLSQLGNKGSWLLGLTRCPQRG